MTAERDTVVRFCGTFVSLDDVHPGLRFFVDGNSKVTWDNGTFTSPRPNAFSLPDVATCPGSTPSCRESCYVQGLREHSPETYERYAENAATLHRVLLSRKAAQRSAAILGDWIAANARGGFRWHVSGDVMHDRHARWIVDVCERAAGVRFWIYTRTLEVVGILASARNLAVNVSADRDNIVEARPVAEHYRVRLCYMAQPGADGSPPELPGLVEGSVIFPDYALRGVDPDDALRTPFWQSLSQVERKMICPADYFGKSESYRCGPCTKCLFPRV